jgi:intermediate peptidase
MPLLEQHFSMQRSLAALETHGQIGVAMLDQAYHSITPESASSFDSTATWHDLNERIGVIPPVRDTAWQIQFGHLHGYGATYYSYLFDRAIAGKVWRTLFNHSPEGSLSREGGEILKEQVLKWGGGRDPWVMVGELVGGKEGETLMRGDEESMRVVGGWEIR